VQQVSTDGFNEHYEWFREFHENLERLFCCVEVLLEHVGYKRYTSVVAPPISPNSRLSFYRLTDPIYVSFHSELRSGSEDQPVPYLVSVLHRSALDSDLKQRRASSVRSVLSGLPGQVFHKPVLAVLAHEPLPHLCAFKLKSDLRKGRAPKVQPDFFFGTLSCQSCPTDKSKKPSPPCSLRDSGKRLERRFRLFLVPLDIFRRGEGDSDRGCVAKVEEEVVRPLNMLLKTEFERSE
jgi:hypothetical protein